MADLIAKAKPFEGISKPEHDRLIKIGVGLVREYFIGGVVVSCWNQDVENFSPRWIRGYGRAYSICCHFCATAIGAWAKENGDKGGIEYLFETGDDYHSEAEFVLAQADKVPVVRDSYQCLSHRFIPKDAGLPFHGADMLAWEWGKYWTETVAQNKRPMRLSLAHLLHGNLHRYKFIHLGGERLRTFFAMANDFGVEQLQQNAAAAAALSPADLTDAVATSGQTELAVDHE